jgi:hypothetical protein
MADLFGAPIIHVFDVKIFEIIRLLSEVGQPMHCKLLANPAHISENIDEQGCTCQREVPISSSSSFEF